MLVQHFVVIRTGQPPFMHLVCRETIVPLRISALLRYTPLGQTTALKRNVTFCYLQRSLQSLLQPPLSNSSKTEFTHLTVERKGEKRKRNIVRGIILHFISRLRVAVIMSDCHRCTCGTLLLKRPLPWKVKWLL